MPRKLSKQLVYVLIILIPFWLLFFNSPFWHNIKMALMGTATSSVAIVRWPLQELEKMISYRKSWNENQKLKREMNDLKSRAIQLEELARQNRRYEKLVSFRERRGLNAAIASVIARDPANWNSSLMINKGKAEGMRPGMPVVNADGVVGKVAEVAAHVSKVILVNDTGFSVAAVDRRSRESGLVSGSLSGRCRMLYLPDNADIQVGDEVITSELSSDFPPGIMVGTISRILPAGDASGYRAEISPTVEVSRIEEVLVIK